MSILLNLTHVYVDSLFIITLHVDTKRSRHLPASHLSAH